MKENLEQYLTAQGFDMEQMSAEDIYKVLQNPKPFNARRYYYDIYVNKIGGYVINIGSFGGILDALQKTIDFLKEIEGIEDSHFRDIRLKSWTGGEAIIQIELMSSFQPVGTGKQTTPKSVKLV